MEHPRRREQGFWTLSPTSLTVAPWFIGGNSHCPGTARRTSSRHNDVPRETVVHPPLSPLSRHTIDPPDQDMRERGEGSRMERCHHRRPMASSHHPPQCLCCTKARRWPSTSGSTGTPDRPASLIVAEDRKQFHVKQCPTVPCFIENRRPVPPPFLIASQHLVHRHTSVIRCHRRRASSLFHVKQGWR